jgi:hypothetical protein
MVGSPLPTKRNNGLNGLPVVRFNASEGRMRMTGTGVSTDFTLLVIARYYNLANAARVVAADYGTGNNFLLGWWSGNQDVIFDGAFSSGDPGAVGSVASTAWRLYAFKKT